VRHFCRAVELKEVTRRVVTCDGASRLQRHARMAADGELK
jgi:hypothetical protein